MAEQLAAQDVNEKASVGGLKGSVSTIIVFAAIILGLLFWKFVLGNPANFEENDPSKSPVAEGVAHWLGLVYKGGVPIGVAVGLFIIIVTFSVERFITLNRAKGKGSMDKFVTNIQELLKKEDLKGAVELADENAGSVGNVVKETLKKYEEMKQDTTLDKDTKELAIKKALEESVALEIPALERNMSIIATIVSVATLVGLIGTVLGMINAFSALASSGAPDQVALANGISEALVNTALGITTSTIATVMYNYFTGIIDSLTYKVDEVGFSIVQTFAEKHG